MRALYCQMHKEDGVCALSHTTQQAHRELVTKVGHLLLVATGAQGVSVRDGDAGAGGRLNALDCCTLLADHEAGAV